MLQCQWQLLQQLEGVVVDAAEEAEEKVDELTNEVEELKQKVNHAEEQKV